MPTGPGRCSAPGTDLRAAQLFFLATSVFPTLAYYLGAERTFPATISWTIRAGWPKRLHHLLWLAGWACTACAVGRVDTAAGLILCAAMVSTGAVAVVLAPIGASARTDRIHHAASLAYILLHIPWFTRWCIPWLPFQAGFYSSLLLFLLNMAYMRHVKRARCAPGLCGFADPLQVTGVELLRRLQVPTASSQPTALNLQKLGSVLYRLELLEMVLENAVFLFFVVGMTARSPESAIS